MQPRPFARLALLLVSCSAAAQVGCAETQEEMHPEVALAPVTASCDATPIVGRLCGCVYDLPLGTKRLPDFGLLRPVELLCVDSLAVSLRNGPPGFPGITGRFEWFGVDFHGALTVGRAGAYAFRLASDDGAKLFIDDALVLNDDGLHDVRTVEGVVLLEPGVHRIRVPYWDGPGPMALTLEVARPGEGYEALRLDHVL
jgi:hypothetical protein